MGWIAVRWNVKILYLFALTLGLGASVSVRAQSPAASDLSDQPGSYDAMAAQQPAAPQTGTITGTIVDKDGAVIPNAKVGFSASKSGGGTETRDTLTDHDGGFSFSGVPPGAFEVTVSAPGFGTRKAPGTLKPGQTYIVPKIALVVATEVDVQVTLTQTEVAEEQLHVEETQRILGVIPNYYVSYVPDAAPLNPRQKFQLAWKASFNPFSFGIAAFIAGIEQADDSFSGYGQGAQGYGKRLGATYADLFAGTFIGGAVLPTVLKQDPRYFYKGTGSRKSRFFYAVSNAVICKGDNGRWQPNYSSMLGALAAGGISNLYYPAQNRNGVGLTFENALIGIGGSALGALAEEFFLRRLTPHAGNPSKTGN